MKNKFESFEGGAGGDEEQDEYPGERAHHPRHKCQGNLTFNLQFTNPIRS